MSKKPLEGKITVITGASRGIGKGLALGFATHGAQIGCVGRNQSDLESIVAEIARSGGQATGICADVSNFNEMVAMYQSVIAAYGQVDIVIVNAGGNLDDNDVEHSDVQNWAKTIEVNLIGAYHTVKPAIPLMKENGGRIIMIGSGLGHRSTENTTAYSSAKAGLWMLTRGLAEELRQYNILVNELIPGPVANSRNHGKAPDNSIFNVEWMKQPEDVVPLALFLATQPDSGPTGQSFSLMRRDSQ